MSREVKAILKARPDLKGYKFIPCKCMKIVIPALGNKSNCYKNIEIYLGTKLRSAESVRFGVSDEIKTVAYKKVE